MNHGLYTAYKGVDVAQIGCIRNGVANMEGFAVDGNRRGASTGTPL